MPILYAELQIAGRQVACEVASFSFEQPTDEQGRPSSVVRIGLLKVVISGEAAGWSLWEEIKFDPYRRESGHVVFFQNQGITAKRYTFYDAALVWLEFRHDGTGTAGRQSATQVELHFSAATIEVNGIRLEAHSIIPWATDAQTSFRALTKPADPQPSAHLAALLTAAKLKAEEFGTGLVKKVITPAGEVATEILGVSAAALARAASLTAGFLLLSNNSKDDPGYQGEWELDRKMHHLLPPDKDKARLAALEAQHAQGTLTAEEEAELIALLAKVKGIRVQQIEELEITIPPEHKIDRDLLDPPIKPGNSPKFKSDGTSVEIHHIGQQREGPFVEMHKEDHRGKGNDKVNHPNKHLPSQVDRREFERAKKRYWKKEFPDGK